MKADFLSRIIFLFRQPTSFHIFVGIKDHAVDETPTVATRALLYIVRASPSFLLHPSFKPYLPYLSSICASSFNFNLPLGFAAALLHERLFQTPSKRRSKLLHIPVTLTRECCIAGFESKVKARIRNQGDKTSLCGLVLEYDDFSVHNRSITLDAIGRLLVTSVNDREIGCILPY